MAFALSCLEDDESVVLLYMNPVKDLTDELRHDGVSEYYLTKIRKLIKAGEGKGHKAKPWQEMRAILVKFR